MLKTRFWICCLLWLSACNLPISADATATPVAAQPTSSPAPVPDLPELQVFQVLLRYDSARENGTFEATICNKGSAYDGAFTVTISTKNGSAEAGFDGEIKTASCHGVFAQESDFSTFGVTTPDRVDVNVMVSIDGTQVATFDEQVDVVQIPVSTDRAALSDLKKCRSFGITKDCLGLNLNDPIPDLDEVKKQSGRYVAITPRAYERVAGFLIADMSICERTIEEYLGIPNPRDVMAEFVMPGRESVYFYSSGMGIGLMEPNTDFLKKIAADELDFWKWRNPLRGYCSQAHEMTHSFVNQTPIPYALNEGLADYLVNRERVNWFGEKQMTCNENSFSRDRSPLENFVPLETLKLDGVNRSALYGTGECFWAYFEETYGHDAFQQALKLLYAQTVQNDLIKYDSYCKASGGQNISFLKTFIEPVIGEDISALTQERFGFGNEYGSCTLN